MAANAPSSTSSRPEDIWGAVAAFAIATLVFYRHMAPEVTLDGAGIFVTGAYQFGVPHPTGHPLAATWSACPMIRRAGSNWAGRRCR